MFVRACVCVCCILVCYERRLHGAADVVVAMGGSNGSADPTYCYSISGKHRPRRPIAYVAPDPHLLIRSML